MFVIYGCNITIQIAIYIISRSWVERPGFPLPSHLQPMSRR